MVPVLDTNKVPLMPCSEKRARKLVECGQAKKYWQKGIFCIMLLKEPSARNYQQVALGVDPGSKREGYTVLTKTKVVMNITSDTPCWVKSHLETRSLLRRKRRQRNAPYRKMRLNSSRRLGFIPPSTKSRWNAKIRIIKVLSKILPINMINVEDIQAVTKPGKRRWNINFSPLETGKNYFYNELMDLGFSLYLTAGYNTKKFRDNRGFNKSKAKLDYIWDAHNVDSHVLAEMILGVNVNPYKGMFILNFLEYHRRCLHVQVPIKGGVRKQYGSTISMGMSRGSALKYKGKIYYLGGCSKKGLSIHNIKTKERTSRSIKIKDVKILYSCSWIVNPNHKKLSKKNVLKKN